MHETHDRLDDQLARLARSLRDGDLLMACLELAEFALDLDRLMHREERVLEVLARSRPTLSTPLPKVRTEHGSLRRLVSAIAAALDAGDEREALELIGKLRSVLLVHLAKEQAFQPLYERRA